MSNKNIPGFVKVGMTSKDVFDRAKQLSQTGVPGVYEVDAIFPSHRLKNDESKAHEKLARYRVDKEHFRLMPSEAVVKVRTALQGRDPAFIKEGLRQEVSELIEKNRAEAAIRLKKGSLNEGGI